MKNGTQMLIETKLQKKEYLKLMFLWFYTKPWMIFISIVGLLMFLSSKLYFIGFNIPFDHKSVFQCIFGGLIVFFIPFMVVKTVNKAFSSRGRLHEKIIYEFYQDKFSIQGESFISETAWNTAHVIKETKKWILLLHNKILINAIPKSNFGVHLHDFKTLIESSKARSKFID